MPRFRYLQQLFRPGISVNYYCCFRTQSVRGQDRVNLKRGTHERNKTIGDEGITVDFRFIKVHTSN